MAVLARWVSPWSRFTELQRETDQLMRDMLARFGSLGDVQGLSPTSTAEGAASWMPAVDVLTRGNDVVVRAELSGVDPARDIDISVHDGNLTIRGQRRHEDRQDNDQFVRVERHYGAFERTLPMPEGVNADDIKAEYRDGVLQVVIPGAAQISSVRKVPVQIANGATKTIEAEQSSQDQAPGGA
jgi:HSP20 family protein